MTRAAGQQLARVQVQHAAPPLEDLEADMVVVAVGPLPGRAGDRACADPVGVLGVAEPGREPALPDGPSSEPAAAPVGHGIRRTPRRSLDLDVAERVGQRGDP